MLMPTARVMQLDFGNLFQRRQDGLDLSEIDGMTDGEML